MRLLLDTHALIWLIGDDARIESRARDAIIDPGNHVFVSIVSFWEIAVKIRIGKLKSVDIGKVMAAVTCHGFDLLHLESHHIAEFLKLPYYLDHRDPFDHQLIAQAIADSLVFVSDDRKVQRYPVQLMTCSNVSVTVQ